MKFIISTLVCLLVYVAPGLAKERPCLVLTADGVKEITTGPKLPLFDKAVNDAKNIVDAAIATGIDVPVPKDMAGGYTHEQHKRNYKHMSLAGALYQITKEDKYADYVKQTLLKYEEIFPTLRKHPAEKSYSRGKLFWQCLNDANWLVYTAQAYDAVYDYLSKTERKKIEDNLLRPYADYISVENPKFFNRVHNHSTWGNAAVGMIGLAINDDELVERALYGLPKDDKENLAYDNDGGFIYENGQAKAGFFAQIDNAFSPDGYYEEGPYYQRYAMTPFMLFASALQNNRPKLNIFAHRDSVLLKAVYALIYQTNEAGEFFPINDAQKGMSIRSLSVISAVDIAYSLNEDKGLLGLAVIQDQVLLDQYGYRVALGISKGDISNTSKKSVQLGDGKDGKQGALTVLRTENGDNDLTLVFKSTGQGLGHGHFDKLGILLYSGSDEVLQDYGSARWVNMDQKQGGRYLPENKSWAKQTLAHNTIIVDGKSHFEGKYKNATGKHSDPLVFDVSDPSMQLAIAADTNAYPGVNLHRTVALINEPAFGSPFVLDLFGAISEEEHTYQMPYQFADRYMTSDPKMQAQPMPIVMGKKHGYQHVYQEAEAEISQSEYSFNWYNHKKFYTITGVSQPGDKLVLARLGANDINFNIRSDAFYLHETKKQKDALFAAIIEPHGTYSYVSEIPNTPTSQIKSIEVLVKTTKYTVVQIVNITETKMLVFISNEKNNETQNHSTKLAGQTYTWTGTHHKLIIN